MKLSLCSTPIGSVGISELPDRLTTVFTSGKRSSVFSTSVVVSTAVERPMLGSLVMVTASAPSSRRGMNSAPSRVARMPLPTSRARAMPMVGTGCRSDRSSSGA